MSVELLEQFVLSKPYFDRHGLIIAEEDGVPIGFAHAGFGPTDDLSTLTPHYGVTCMVMVRSPATHPEVAEQLLQHSEQYLRSRGAKVIYGGCINPLNPFYLGLYGGSELPGVLDSDLDTQRLYLDNNYREIDRVVVLHKDISSFRPLVDRGQMMVRRCTTLESVTNPQAESWWEACIVCGFERQKHVLRDRQTNEIIASATFREMHPFSRSWGVHAAGLTDLCVAEPYRRRGFGSFLLGDALRQFRDSGVSLVEAQTMQRNTPAVAFYGKLGFHKIDSGAIYRKQ